MQIATLACSQDLFEIISLSLLVIHLSSWFYAGIAVPKDDRFTRTRGSLPLLFMLLCALCLF